MRRFTRILMLPASVVACVLLCVWLWQAEESALFGCPRVSGEEAARLVAGRQQRPLQTTLLFNGSPAAEARELGGYLITQPDNRTPSGVLSAEDPSVCIYIRDPQQGDEGYEALVLQGEDSYSSVQLIPTTLPVLSLVTREAYDPGTQWRKLITSAEQPVGDERLRQKETEEVASYLFFSPQQGLVRVQQGELRFHIRGQTASRFPKKSLRVHLLDSRGGQDNESLAGLRSDDDWILNALYTDGSKIRDKLSLEVWNDVAAANGVDHDNGSRMEYVELVINGSYCGLYGLQEPIDRKQLDPNPQTDYLYHSIQLPNISGEAMEHFAYIAESAMGKVIQFPSWDTDFWRPMLNYTNALYWGWIYYQRVDLETAQRLCSFDNMADYFLWKQFTGAGDNGGKNTSYAAYYDPEGWGGLRFVRIPWDTNYTFGNTFDDLNMQTLTAHEEDWARSTVQLDPVFYAVFITDPAPAISLLEERWALLREDALNGERVAARAREIYLPLAASGALERDSIRWPDAPSPGVDIDEFCADIEERFRFLDEYIAGLGVDYEDEYWRMRTEIANS